MKTKKITEVEASSLGVSSLPTRPNAPSYHGGAGYSAEEMKAAFDRLPRLIIERFNHLISDIEAEGDNGISSAIKTELSDGHTLRNMFGDIKNGNFASYLTVGEKSLYSHLALINERLCGIESTLDMMKSTAGEEKNE